MKKLVIACAIFVASCASYQPTALNIDSGRRAAMPTSKGAVEEAVKAYFSSKLFDPYSAQYSLSEPINSYMGWYGDPMHGWFVCGTVNAKNRMGGYVGASPFWAYFDPANPEVVAKGYIWDRETLLSGRNCKDIEANRTDVKWLPLETNE